MASAGADDCARHLGGLLEGERHRQQPAAAGCARNLRRDHRAVAVEAEADLALRAHRERVDLGRPD